MCGLPFKMLEKKAEKKAILLRRMELKQSLEKAENPDDVFKLTVLILFQQVSRKNLNSSFLYNFFSNLFSMIHRYTMNR